MIKMKNRHILSLGCEQFIEMVNVTKLPVNSFKSVEKTSQFNEDSIKRKNEESDEEYFLEVDIQCPKELHDLHRDLPFLLERIRIRKVEKLVANLHDKYIMLLI